jgi:hypothetical protein
MTRRLVLCFAGACVIACAQQFTPIAEGPYTISGTVVSANTGELLPRTRVFIVDTKNRSHVQSMITKDDGKFAFHVPAGKFSLQAIHRGFILAAYDQHEEFSTAIVTGTDVDSEHLNFKLVPQAMISGTVYDESGEPQQQAIVSVYHQDRSRGISRVTLIRRVMTDDLGAYEIPRLDAGAYFLSASAEPWYAVHPPTTREDLPAVVDPALDVAYPPLYYADANEPDEATPIPLRGGDHQTIDLHLSPVPALHIVYRADPNNLRIGVPQLFRHGFDSEEFPVGSAHRTSGGVIELSGIPAGSYSVRLPTPEGAMGASEDIDLEQNAQELSGEGKPNSSDLKFTVKVASGPLPSQLRIGLQTQSGRFVRAGNMQADGTTELPQVESGTYKVLVQGSGGMLAVEQIQNVEHVSQGSFLTVSEDSPREITLLTVAGKADVEGQVVHAGKGFAGAMVVLVPDDPDAHHELFRRDQSDLDGTFRLQNIVPGKYTILAIQDGWDLDWARPAVIASYGKHGQKITVGGETLHLEEPIELQSK